MTATTEPPWLHKSSGVAPRNNTTSHTITFGTDGDAPFTPGTGSLLVFIIFGAVTHTAAGSWTEQLQPVSSGELSVFTSTNNSSTAPPTSIVITHNGSNYPAPWCVMEFPAGSAYVSGTSNTTTVETFPTLSGLTGGAGNERVIVGARGRTSQNVSETSVSSTWSSPWVEDADQWAPIVGATDGGYLTVGHQINVTATSATPVATTTYGGTWATTDREKAVFAINAVPVSAPASEGSASFTFDLAPAATGARDSAGAAALGLDLAPAATGARGSAGAAALGLDLATAAEGERDSTGVTALSLGLAVAVAGERDSTGAAALGLGMAVAAAGERDSAGTAALGLDLEMASTGDAPPIGPAEGSASFTIDLAPAASGARDAAGSAALGLDLAPATAGARDAAGSAALGLGLALASTGSDGESGRPVAAYPWTPSPIAGYPWAPVAVPGYDWPPRAVKSFSEVTP